MLLENNLKSTKRGKGKIIGVMKDFNFASLRKKVEPLAVILTDNPLYVSVKLKAGTIPSSLAYMQKTWKQFTTEHPFDYFFLDEQLNHFYESDVKLLHVLNIFAVLAIFIACIGLFGLSIYTAKQRTKEIGIRKVLGATVTSIVGMLSKDFIKLVLIAAIIAFPVSWWAMNYGCRILLMAQFDEEQNVFFHQHSWFNHWHYRLHDDLSIHHE